MGRRTGLIASISLGLVIILVQIWMLTQVNALFPDNVEEWRLVIITYITITALVFASDSLRSPEKTLFRVSFLKRFPIFLISAIITLAVLLSFQMFIRGDTSFNVIEALGNVGLGVILLHAFIVSVNEELIFRKFAVDELRARRIKENTVRWTQAIIFALFHFALAGGEILLLITYIPLGVLFLWVRDKYSPKTQMANAGVHFGWNLFILGFLQRTVI